MYNINMPPIPRHIIIKHEGESIEVSNSHDSDSDDDDADCNGNININSNGNNGRNRNKSNNNNNNNNTRPPIAPKNLPLVDEIDLQQCLVSPSAPWQASRIQGVVIGKEQLEVMCNHTISGSNGNGRSNGNGNGNGGSSGNKQWQTINGGGDGAGQACPCCRRFIQQAGGGGPLPSLALGDGVGVGSAALKILPASSSTNSKTIGNSDSDHHQITNHEEPGTGALTSLWTSLTKSTQPMTMTMANMAAPPLTRGDQMENYTIVETIVQGWLYKKGTGGDWAGRRWWKPRWVTLALAETPNTIVPTPCLLSHRAPGVPYPASIMELTESTVIMAIERTHSNNDIHNLNNNKDGTEKQRTTATSTTSPDKEEWNRHCFQIVHTRHQDNETTPKTTTRIFTAPSSERNEWVFAMNNALMGYEKRLSKARSKARTDAAKIEYAEARALQSTKKARRSGFDGLKLCGELTEKEQSQNHEEGKTVAPLMKNPSWTNNTSTGAGRSRSIIGGTNSSSRMRSPSPVPRASKALMGLPPTSPRRGMVISPRRRDGAVVRSPSPRRFTTSSSAGQHRSLDSSLGSIAISP